MAFGGGVAFPGPVASDAAQWAAHSGSPSIPMHARMRCVRVCACMRSQPSRVHGHPRTCAGTPSNGGRENHLGWKFCGIKSDPKNSLCTFYSPSFWQLGWLNEISPIETSPNRAIVCMCRHCNPSLPQLYPTVVMNCGAGGAIMNGEVVLMSALRVERRVCNCGIQRSRKVCRRLVLVSSVLANKCFQKMDIIRQAFFRIGTEMIPA